MDESPMSQALGAVEFAGGISLEEQPPARAAARRAPLPWRNYTRCLLLAVVVGAAGWTAFRPALLRLSVLMSLVSPSRGESLAWKPEPEEEARPAPMKFTPPPDEWRPGAGHAAGWLAERPSPREDAWQGGAPGAGAWKRESFNPWDWSDDAGRGARRLEAQDNAPGQKAESSFRASEAKDWTPASGSGTAAPAESAPAAATASPEASATQPAPATSAFSGAPAGRVPSVAPLAPLPATQPEAKSEPAPALSLPPALLSIPQLPQLPSAQPPELPAGSAIIPAPTLERPAFERPAADRIVSEPLSLSALPAIGVPEAAAAPQAQPSTQQPPAPQAAGTISPAQALSAAFAAAPGPQAQPAAPAASIPAAPSMPAAAPTPVPSAPASVPPGPIDWMEREITGPVPGAYLTIYPKLKFVGLCVPGQGYIRKYNQIAVPMDLTELKQHAADGRTPYGKYYVAGHIRDAAGPRVVLSWPSVDDARHAGVGPEMLALIDGAWSRQAMPPQDSFAGGGLSLAGDRAASEYTSGGFSLEAPHMEEIFTALPDGAWVFVQQ